MDVHQAEKKRFINIIENSLIQGKPFQHAVIHDIFSVDFYNQLISFLPSKELYKEVKNIDSYITSSSLNHSFGLRYELWLNSDEITPLNKFWHTLNEWLACDEVISALYSKFYTTHYSAKKLKLSNRLVKEEGVCYIEPHLDKPFKILTVVIYLGVQDALLPGTTLINRLNPNDNKDVPFSKNTGLIIINSPQSWHMVEKTKISTPRNTLHLYLKKINFSQNEF